VFFQWVELALGRGEQQWRRCKFEY